jgi:hypothetical protein
MALIDLIDFAALTDVPCVLRGKELITVWKTIYEQLDTNRAKLWTPYLPIDYPFVLPKVIVNWIWKNEFSPPKCYNYSKHISYIFVLHAARMRANELGIADINEYVKLLKSEIRYIHFDKSGFTIKKEGIYPIKYIEEIEHFQLLSEKWYEDTNMTSLKWNTCEMGIRLILASEKKFHPGTEIVVKFCSYLLLHLYEQKIGESLLERPYYKDRVLTEWAEGSEYVPDSVKYLLTPLIKEDNTEYIGESNNAILSKWGPGIEDKIALEVHTILARKRMEMVNKHSCTII